MNTIKRDVYVIRNTIKIPIEVTKGTDMVGIEFTVRDFDIPATAAAVAYSYNRKMKKPNSQLCDVKGNVISFTPGREFFEVGMNELQIRVINEDKALISFKEKVKCSDAMGFPDDEEEKQQTLIEQLLSNSGKETGERKKADETERNERTAAIEKEKNERTQADATEKSERKAEIDVERKRIDNLAKLPAGSTTGDAELKDIRVGADGTIYGNAGEAVRQQVGSLKEDLDNLSVNKLLGETTITVYNNLEETTNGTIANTARWFLPKTINAYTLIDNITLSTNLSVGKSTDIIFTLWKKANNTLTKICDKEIRYTEVGRKKIVVPVNEIPKSNFMISIWTSVQASIDYVNDTSSTYYTKDLSSETLNMGDLSSLPNSSIKCEISTRRNYIGISGSILTVGTNKQYETIQEAIDNANDSESNPVTIIVFPGIYEPFSMVGFPFVTGNNTNNKLRYLSIIGIDRFRTFIIDHVGDYRRPPAEIRTRGYIANLQFITDHTATSDDSDWDESEVKRRAYAIHMDFGHGQKVVIKNCIIKSAHAPAIGIGLYQDDSITIDDCELYSTADNSFGGMRDYGALYCHSCNVANITNQYINIKNSMIESQSSKKGGAFFQLLQNGKAYLRSINTMYYSFDIDSPKATNSGFVLQPQSYGNNFDEFNA